MILWFLHIFTRWKGFPGLNVAIGVLSCEVVSVGIFENLIFPQYIMLMLLTRILLLPLLPFCISCRMEECLGPGERQMLPVSHIASEHVLGTSCQNHLSIDTLPWSGAAGLPCRRSGPARMPLLSQR
jgi:hypothetical protein